MKMGVGDFEEDLALIQAIARSAREEEGQAMEEDDDDASGPPAGAAAQPEPSTGEPGSSNGSRKGSTRSSNMMLLDEGGPVVEVFRNFAAEGMAVPQSVMPQSRRSVEDHGMESMFPPPADLMYHGSFDTLRRDAEEQQKYCLINIQKTDVFDSHALNRDTWKVRQHEQHKPSVSCLI